ncbi:MAG: hypothetical protein GQ551_12780, partial [Myxococcales bacterium]|nr:hypothetical protein [Myxococcales bacterium]
MVARGDALRLVLAWVVAMAAVPAAAQGAVAGTVAEPASVAEAVPAAVPASVAEPVNGWVLVSPVQGSEALRVRHGGRVLGAVRRALQARGYRELASQELLGKAVVACQTPECVEQTLDAAGAAFAIVPAIWLRESGGEELTLTLVQKSGRSLNANGVIGDDLSGIAADLVDELLERQAAAVAAEASAAAASVAVPAPSAVAPSEPAHPHAWKAGPIILIAGGAAAIVTVGVAAGIRSDTQQFNTAAVATWSAIGAAAIAG